MSSKPKYQPAPKKPPLSSSSALGAVLLIAQQFGSRALTFIVNQVLLRYLSPDLLGISTQLEVYSITVLLFARESLRVAIQRQADTPDNESEKKDDEKVPSGYVDGRTAAGRTQAIVNLSYISIFFGPILALGVGWLYLRTTDANVSSTPYFSETLALYAVSAFVELLAEPCYVVVQQKSRFSIRASAESVATIFRCLVTCGSAIVFSRLEMDVGALPFALGQAMYAFELLVIYYLNVVDIATASGFSLVIKKIYSPDQNAFISSYLSRPLLNLSITFLSQSTIKWLLTQGDTLLISSLTTLSTQGVYALAANYGGLIARLLLQPIEEMSRNYFGKLLSSPSASASTSTSTPSPPSKTAILQARDTLIKILKSYLLISIPIISIGPTLAPLLLNLIAGSKWSTSGAGEVLATYCYYIPLLALNGLTEAFVSSVSSESELNRQTVWMVGFTAGFAGAAVLFLRALDMGARGLVWANALNMAFRIVWCSAFIRAYLKRSGTELEVRSLMPQPLSVAVGVGTSAVMSQLGTTFTGGLMDIIKSGAVSVVFVVVFAFSERKHLLECYQDFRGQRQSQKAVVQ